MFSSKINPSTRLIIKREMKKTTPNKYKDKIIIPTQVIGFIKFKANKPKKQLATKTRRIKEITQNKNNKLVKRMFPKLKLCVESKYSSAQR